MKSRILLSALGVAAMAVSVASPAQAGVNDKGDGLLGCNAYEICLARDTGGAGSQRHFMYGSAHGGDTWGTGSYAGTPLQDSASSVNNKDTSGSVYVYDYRNGTRYDVYIPRNSGWVYVGTSMNDKNDGHLIL